MRTLSGTLLAAQQASSRTPYIRLEGPTETFTNLDAYNRIVSVDDWEEPYGGACTIRLRSADQHFKNLNWRGEKFNIGWGFVTSAGNEYSENRQLWILNQRDISMEGELVTEFLCIDNWARIAANYIISAGKVLTGTLSGDFTFGETITGSISGATAKLVGASSDSIIVGSISGAFQVGEDAAGATASCENITAITDQSLVPTTWERDTTILNILKSILSGLVADVVIDSDDPDNTINTYKPLIELPAIARTRALVRQLFQRSKCGARLGNEANDGKLHTLYLNTAAAAEYSYNADHAFYSDVRERAAILPNKVIMVDRVPDAEGNAAQYVGEAQGDTTIGTFITIEVDPTIQSNAEATKRAEAWIAQRVAEANQGRIVVPMNCGQELYDMIDVTDSRADVTVKGRVGRIDRHFSEGRYAIELRLGGLLETPGATGVGPDAIDWDIKDISIATPKDRIALRKLVYPWQLWKAVQPYVCDITFSAVDKNHIGWGAGTIYFADGSQLSISSKASQATPNPGWLYFTEGSAVLIYTTSFADCVAPTHGLVAFVAPGSETGQTALIWPAAGKQPLLNADIITCMTLSSLTANVGLLNAGIIQSVTFKVVGDRLRFYVDVEDWGSYFAGEIRSSLGLFEVNAHTGYDLDLSGENMVLSTPAGDITLKPDGRDVIPWSIVMDLGTASNFWDDINYSDLIDRTSSPVRILDALTKLKAINAHTSVKKRKGHPDKIIDTFDRDSLPMELIVPVSQRDRDKAEDAYQVSLKRKHMIEGRISELEQMKRLGRDEQGQRMSALDIRNADNAISERRAELQSIGNPVKLVPQPGISMNATIGLLLSAIKELTEKVEKLEKSH